MQMQVKNALAGLRAVIDRDPEGITMALGLGNLAADEHQMAQNRLILSRGVGQAGDGFARHDQNMHRGLGINIAEGHAMFIFMHDIARDFSVDDLFKKGFGHGLILCGCRRMVARRRGGVKIAA